MRRFRGLWAIFIFRSKLTWVKSIFFVQIRSLEIPKNITFWVDLRQKNFFQVWWSLIFGWKNFRKNEIVSKPLYITFLGKNASIQGVLSDFYFLLKTNMGQNYLQSYKLDRRNAENITFWDDLRQKKFFKV